MTRQVGYGQSSLYGHLAVLFDRFADDAEAGVVEVNDKTTGLELHVPFGGVKKSSSETWREQGDAGLEFHTVEKTVYDNY